MYTSAALSWSARHRPLAHLPLLRYKRTLATAMLTTNRNKNGGMLTRLWRSYQDNLQARPLLTKAFMASLIFFVSDSCAQYIMRRKVNDKPDDDSTLEIWRWDASRALSGAGFGVIATTWLHFWWGFLEASVGRMIPVQRYRLSNTMVKVAIDQLLGAPFYIYSYYVLTNFLQDAQDQRVPLWQSWQENNQKATEMLWPTMMQHWKLWPVVHSFNFYFAPLHHRVLVQNIVLVGWSGYLSHLNHADTKLMTPDEEIKLVRRESEKRMAELQQKPEKRKEQ